MNQRKKLAAEKDKNRVGLPKAQPLDGINPFVFAGTEDGDIVYVDWMPQKDVKTAKMQTSMPAFVAPQHDGPISYIARSPFMSEVILCVGGFSWSLWKEGVTSGALLCSAPYSKAVTGNALLLITHHSVILSGGVPRGVSLSGLRISFQRFTQGHLAFWRVDRDRTRYNRWSPVFAHCTVHVTGAAGCGHRAGGTNLLQLMR